MSNNSSKPSWPELAIPAYRPTTLWPWSLQMFESLPQQGYFHDRQERGDIYVLLQNGESWMSTSLDEIESQAQHVAAAKNHVVVMGAGMGVAVYNILRKPEVTHVTVVEKDPLVIDLLHQATDMDQWVGIEKLDVAILDAFDFVPDEAVNHLYVDIWAKAGDPQALTDTQRIQKQVRAETVGWWTQEIDFLNWLEEKDYGLPPSLEHYREWTSETGLPLIGQNDTAYMVGISQVARSYCYQMFLQTYRRGEKLA